MINPATNPSTIDGIRRKAKKLKKELGISHLAALEHASKLSNFQNYLHAKRSLFDSIQSSSFDQEPLLVYLTVYWVDAKQKRSRGRETLEVSLNRPLSSLITRQQAREARNLSGFKMEAIDHFEMEVNADSHERACELLSRAALTLKFIEATSLVPITRQAQFDVMKITSELPRKDHMSRWIDPVSGAWLALDEPYVLNESEVQRRTSWATANNLGYVEPNWGGLYFPGQSKPYLLSPDRELLTRILNQVESFGAAPVIPVETVSASYYSDFTSPARVANGKARKQRPGPSYREYMGAQPYGGLPGIASKWRPAKTLTLKTHLKLAPLVRSICMTGQAEGALTYKAHKKINSVRSLLEDWCYIEHGEEISREQEDDLYYGNNKVQGCTSPLQTLRTIKKVREIIIRGYGECKPRRDLIAKIDTVEKYVMVEFEKN